MRNFERDVVGRFGIVLALLCFVSVAIAGFARPAHAEETTHGNGKSDTATFLVASESRGIAVLGAPAATGFDLAPRGTVKTGRTALDQPGCTLCLTGAASVTWNGNSGSFQVDHIVNNGGTGSGALSVTVVLAGPLPTFGQTVSGAHTFSSGYSLSPLQAGYQYSSVNSGPFHFSGARCLQGCIGSSCS